MRRETIITLFMGVLSSFPLLAFDISQQQPRPNVASSVVWKAPQGRAEDFAGTEACIACHPVHSDMFSKTPHAKAAPKDATSGAGCESCHRPGKAHVQAIEAAGGDDQKIAEARK